MHYATTLYKGLFKGHNKEVHALNYETTKLINFVSIETEGNIMNCIDYRLFNIFQKHFFKNIRIKQNINKCYIKSIKLQKETLTFFKI